jgi:septal ring factor EnvC (AmiA/AmiB activator)
LEDKLNEEKHWKTKYERMKEKYESQRRKFDEQIDTLEVQVNKIYEERNQAEMDLYEKIADIERLTVKVKELEKNKEDNQYLARI